MRPGPSPVRKNCATCDGSGEVDTGGFDQAGRPILRPCPECREVDHLRRLYRAMAQRSHDAEGFRFAELGCGTKYDKLFDVAGFPYDDFDDWLKVVEPKLLERGPDPE